VLDLYLVGDVKSADDCRCDIARLVALVNAANLCGIVTRIPSTFNDAVTPAMTTSSAPSGTCNGTQMPLWPRSAKVRVRLTGDWAYLMGSPTIGNSRDAPLNWLIMWLSAFLRVARDPICRAVHRLEEPPATGRVHPVTLPAIAALSRPARDPPDTQDVGHRTRRGVSVVDEPSVGFSLVLFSARPALKVGASVGVVLTLPTVQSQQAARIFHQETISFAGTKFQDKATDIADHSALTGDPAIPSDSHRLPDEEGIGMSQGAENSGDRGPTFDGVRIGRPATGALIDAGYTSLDELPDDLEELSDIHGVGPKAISLLKAARSR
jgi:hypothetical protein